MLSSDDNSSTLLASHSAGISPPPTPGRDDDKIAVASENLAGVGTIEPEAICTKSPLLSLVSEVLPSTSHRLCHIHVAIHDCKCFVRFFCTAQWQRPLDSRLYGYD